ncbi:hypothetical protein ACF06P_35470 [Streptomyces sp. NPDC015684]|uniref:hypothetical protein n=1 Tax=Streptomyces sp. NPDC015684 TaxID=3364963 RepID=UPI0036FD0B94
MIDPISVGASSLAKAASSAVTKQLTSKAGMRLGSRDERRQVYARFQATVTESHTNVARLHLEMRLFTAYLGKRRVPIVYRPGATLVAREALRELKTQQSEMLQAYLDLRLVANPAPLEAADAVLEQLGSLFDLTLGASDEQVNTAVSDVVAAQRELTDVCRDDLWYLPQRWQVYRPLWWKARRWRRAPGALPS